MVRDPMSKLLNFLALYSREAASKLSSGNRPWPVPFPEPCSDLSGREPAFQVQNLARFWTALTPRTQMTELPYPGHSLALAHLLK